MADRSQNITINYKFNTAEIEKANAILNRANTATNTLQAAGQKAGQQISTSYGQAGKSIEAMNIQLARLKTQIQVSSDPKRVADLSNQYKVLKAEIDKATVSAFKLPKALKETQQATQSLASQFGNLYAAVKLVVTAGILKEVVSIGLEMATLSGNVDGVTRAFNRAFPDAENLLFNLRRATKETVTEFDLMKRTLQATNLGVAVESLPILFEFAAARAQQTGESVDYLVDSIVRGIGRKSILVLDNLGLSATRLKEQFNGASIASQSVADVTKGVAEIARVELEKMGGYMDTAATKTAGLEASFQRLRQELGKKLTGEGGFVDFLKDYADTFGNLIEAQNRGISVSELSEEQRTKEIANISANEFALRVLTGTQEENVKAVEAEIAALTSELGAYAKQRQAAEETIKTLNSLKTRRYDEYYQIQDNIKIQEQFIESKKGDAAIDQEILRILQAKLEAMRKVAGEQTTEILTIEKLKEQLKSLQDQREKETFVGDTAELDRLQREIILLDDRILKISDNIKWQKQWDQSRALSALQTETETANLKRFNDELDKLTEKLAGGDISFSTGDLLNPNRDAKEVLDIDAIEESTKEVAELIKMTLGQEFLIRFRLGLQGKGGETSDLQAGINAAMKEFQLGLVDIAADQLNATREIELQSMKLRLNDLKKFFDDQIELAGNNEQAKRALRKREEKETAELNRQIFEKEKKTRRSQAIIDGAAGVVKAFATYPWPVALIISGLLTAKTLSQLAIINKQKPGFAKGVIGLRGPGSETSDSIPVNLSRNESVMTAWETRHAGDVLKDIRAKKLDNKVLKNLKQGREPIVSQQQFNDEKIIKAIEKNRPPDVIEQSGIVYKVTQKGEVYRNKVRAKSVRL